MVSLCLFEAGRCAHKQRGPVGLGGPAGPAIGGCNDLAVDRRGPLIAAEGFEFRSEVEVFLVFGGRDHLEGAMEAAAVEPVDVLERRDLEVLDAVPRAPGVNEFGLVQADRGFGEGVTYESPLEPTDATAPVRASRSV